MGCDGKARRTGHRGWTGEAQLKSSPNSAEALDRLIWAGDGRLRLTVVLAVLLAAHLLTMVMVVHLLAPSDTVAAQLRAPQKHNLPGALHGAQTSKAHE
jgi:hypothetical protein